MAWPARHHRVLIERHGSPAAMRIISSEAAWRGVLDDLIARGLRTPEFLIVDGGAGLEQALAALWPDVPAQRCTRKFRPTTRT